MQILKKHLIVVIFLFYFTISSYSQCLLSFGKINIFTDGNIGIVAATDLGKGYEIAGGLGVEWAPFNKVFYIVTNIKYVNHFLNDNSPDIDVFPSNPNKIEINSKIVRGQYGIKIRLDGWFKKIDPEGFHFFVGVYYLTDALIKNKANLFFENSLTNSITNSTNEILSGKLYEIGYSFAFNKNIKWDFGMYGYGIEGKSEDASENDYSKSKISFGINTGLIFTL